MFTFFKYLNKILRYEFKLARASGNHLSANLFFLVLYNIVFAFFLNSMVWNSSLLEILIYWVGVLVTYFMSIERYFSSSYRDGVIEFYLTLPRNAINIIFFTKCCVHWLIYGTTSGLIAYPIFVWCYGASTFIASVISTSVILASLLFSILGGISYNLAIRLPYKSTILSVILFPIYFPILLISINIIELSLTNELNIVSSFGLWIASITFCTLLGCVMNFYSLKYSIDY